MKVPVQEGYDQSIQSYNSTDHCGPPSKSITAYGDRLQMLSKTVLRSQANMKQSITLPRELVNTLALNLYYTVKVKEKQIVERISSSDFNINVISTKMSVVFYNQRV